MLLKAVLQNQKHAGLSAEVIKIYRISFPSVKRSHDVEKRAKYRQILIKKQIFRWFRVLETITSSM